MNIALSKMLLWVSGTDDWAQIDSRLFCRYIWWTYTFNRKIQCRQHFFMIFVFCVALFSLFLRKFFYFGLTAAYVCRHMWCIFLTSSCSMLMPCFSTHNDPFPFPLLLPIKVTHGEFVITTFLTSHICHLSSSFSFQSLFHTKFGLPVLPSSPCTYYL